LLNAVLALERIAWEAGSAVSSERVVVLADRVNANAGIVGDEVHMCTLQAVSRPIIRDTIRHFGHNDALRVGECEAYKAS
jgi:hypothetical protein